MNLSEHVKIDTVYTRSINIERDFDSEAIIGAYIPTSRAKLTLGRVAETLRSGDIPRAWALIGPYGSGKSSFAMFLSHLLSDPLDNHTNAAKKVLRKADKGLYKIFLKYTTGGKGYLPVLLTGSPEPFAKRVAACLLDSVVKYWGNRRGPKPLIIKKLQSIANQKEVTPKDIISVVEELQKKVAEGGGRGVVFVFDEFGKFLEYEARHYGANDIYLLQLLAELAKKGNEANILLFALMHQGFEQYAKGLGDNLRNEWAKIQGRFENIPFLETTEQTLRVLSSAFVKRFSKEQSDLVSKRCQKIVKILYKQKALPGTLDEKSALEIFCKCYPLHPLSALLLPLLCSKMAQNERTLFSYIGSKESFGFRDRINNIKDLRQWVFPWEIYEYFILNQPAALDDPTTHRRWAEVVTAIERLGDAPRQQINLLKSIGLLNIIGAQGGLKASKEIVKFCLDKKVTVIKTAEKLIEQSVVQYRKYSGEYRVWQGSDFDLDVAVQEELDQIGIFDLPAAINSRKSLHPIVARRHTIRTGSLRYYQPVFVDSTSFKKEPEKTAQQRIVLYLYELPEDKEVFLREAISYFSSLDILVLCQNGSQIREAVGEVLALNRVQANRQELNSDPVAQREFKDRLSASEQREDLLLSSFFDNPQDSLWYWSSQKLITNTKRDLQRALSRILDNIYYLSPILKNELINRDKPSAQANAARNKLIVALRNFEDKKELGIDKFPAEKGIYRALLKATKLHRKVGEGWKILPPKFKKPENDIYNISPVWKRIEEFLFTTEQEPRSFTDLSAELSSPPYGIKLGVLPLIYFTVYTCYKENVALYENGKYIPYVTDQHIERFIKRPDFFKLQQIWISGIRASLFKQYIKVLYGDKPQKRSLLSIARPLAKFMSGLEEYTKNTTRISDMAQKVIKSFNIANSPDELLFVRLPEACGFGSIDPDSTDDKKVEEFAIVLVEVIRELKNAFEEMILDMQKILKQALLPDIKSALPLSELRIKLKARYEDLYQYTADVSGLRPFIKHISEENCDDKIWLQRILLFLGNKAVKSWSDVDRDGVVFRLSELSKRIIDLRILQDHHLKRKSKHPEDFEIFLLRSARHGELDFEEIVTIDRDQERYVQETREKIDKLLTELKDEKSRIAVLAQVVDNILTSRALGTQPQKKLKVINE